MTAPTCNEQVWRGGTWDGRFAACGRKIKDDGLCGFHLSMKVRRDAKDADAVHHRAIARELADLADVQVVARKESGRWMYQLNTADTENLVRLLHQYRALSP